MNIRTLNPPLLKIFDAVTGNHFKALRDSQAQENNIEEYRQSFMGKKNWSENDLSLIHKVISNQHLAWIGLRKQNTKIEHAGNTNTKIQGIFSRGTNEVKDCADAHIKEIVIRDLEQNSIIAEKLKKSGITVPDIIEYTSGAPKDYFEIINPHPYSEQAL